MKPRTIVVRALAAALFPLLVALPAAADAPTSPPQYAQFTGDSVTIKDNFTLLEWQRRPSPSLAEWSIAQGNCAMLTSLGTTGRLPSVKELLTILDEDPHQEFEFGAYVPKMIDQVAFPDTPVSDPYWTSTSAGGTSYWTVDFKTGLMAARDASQSAAVRCVH